MPILPAAFTPLAVPPASCDRVIRWLAVSADTIEPVVIDRVQLVP